MAHHKSAIKRIRRNNSANVRNSQYLSSVRTAVKKFRLAVIAAGEGKGEKEQVRPLFVSAQSMLAKAATKGILHRNNVSRKIGRLSAMLRSAEAGEVAQANVKSTKKSAAVRRAEANQAATLAASEAATKTAAKKAIAAKKVIPGAAAPAAAKTTTKAKKK